MCKVVINFHFKIQPKQAYVFLLTYGLGSVTASVNSLVEYRRERIRSKPYTYNNRRPSKRLRYDIVFVPISRAPTCSNGYKVD